MEVNAEKHVLKMFETNGKEKEGRETGRRKQYKKNKKERKRVKQKKKEMREKDSSQHDDFIDKKTSNV